MDKETLSHYGWIVICVLVLSIMIAMATPFGDYIGNAVKSTTEGLFDVQQKAMGVAGLVVDDQEFDESGAETPSLISFQFYPHYSDVCYGEYQAEEGMTWEEWFGSKYNTTGYFRLSQHIDSYGDILVLEDQYGNGYMLIKTFDYDNTTGYNAVSRYDTIVADAEDYWWRSQYSCD